MTDPKPTRSRRKPDSAELPASLNGQSAAIAQSEPKPQPLTHPAVVVMRIPTGEPGQERIEFMEINGIDPLAVPTLLRMAANLKEKQLNGEGR